MQLHYLLVVIVVSDVKVMSSTVAVIVAITWVVNNYNIQTKPSYFESNRTKLSLNRIRVFFGSETEPRLKRSIPHIPSHNQHTSSSSSASRVGSSEPCWLLQSVWACGTWGTISSDYSYKSMWRQMLLPYFSFIWRLVIRPQAFSYDVTCCYNHIRNLIWSNLFTLVSAYKVKTDSGLFIEIVVKTLTKEVFLVC